MRIMNPVAVPSRHLASSPGNLRTLAGRWSLALLVLATAAPSAAAPRVVAANKTSAGDVSRTIASLTRPEAMHPIERKVRDQFPTVALDSQATLNVTEEFVAGRMVSGMRARHPHLQSSLSAGTPNALRVFYPGSYDEPFVAELGKQRVALRAVGARFAAATASAGKLFYAGVHDSVDVIEVPSAGRSEELLVLHDARAPRVFEYEIVEMSGVAGVSLEDGAVRFLSDRVAVPTTGATAGGRFATPEPSLQIDRPWVIDANGKRSENAARWTVVEERGQPRRIRLTISSDLFAYPLVVDPSFSVTGNLGGARFDHTATLLPNGKVLIAGGNNGSANLNTAELYDPSTGAFTSAGTMTNMRSGHTATLLTNGKVLIAGGISAQTLQTAELYDPIAGTFTLTDTMTAARANHTATLLPNGKVLLAGGSVLGASLNTTDLYDNGTFTGTGNLIAARQSHTATLLPNGKVLIAGGYDGAALNTTELYDPANLPSTAGGNMIEPRLRHTATLLPNGTVLIAGGTSSLLGVSLSSAELYLPAGNGFTGTGTMNVARQDHTATLLPNGKVLIAGGGGNGLSSAPLNTAELYEPTAGSFTTSVTMTGARWNHTATLLPNGIVLIAGGQNPAALNTAELYEPATGTFTATGSMTSPRLNFTATSLASGMVLLAAGESGSGLYSSSAELYDPSTGTSTATGTMVAARYRYKANLLPDGKVLLVGGNSPSPTAEVFNPATGTFTATGNMTIARQAPTATLLRNGKVLVTGGYFGLYTRTAEVYDPATGSFTATGNMTQERGDHTATLLATGKVLVAGGWTGVLHATAELYDPDAGTFTATGSMAVPRFNFTATLLPGGKVLVAGGESTGGTFVNTAELYDPVSGTFTGTGSMSTGRNYHTATLMPNGKVLIAGGRSGSGTSSSSDLYDPATGLFTPGATMTTARSGHASALLPNGTVLIAGGFGSAYQNSAELFDAGAGIADSRRPLVSTATNPVCLPGSLVLNGSLFTGDAEGSSGSTNSSPSNAPLLRLQRVDNGQLLYGSPQSFSATAFNSVPLNNLDSGIYRSTIVSNGIPSISRMVAMSYAPLLGTYPRTQAHIGAFFAGGVAPSSLPAGYNGSFYPIRVTASAGFTGTLGINANTGFVKVNNVGPSGSYTITVSSTTICGSASTSFILDVNRPSDVVATATGATSVAVTWSSSFDFTYEIARVSAGGEISLGTVIANFDTTTFVDNTAAPNTAYLYKVRIYPNEPYGEPDLATTVIFTDPTLTAGSTTVKAAHFIELRTAVNAVRTLAGLPLLLFTDPTLAPGSTPVKAIHLTELRTRLDAARSTLLLPAVTSTNSGAAGTFIRAADINELRNGVK